MTTRGGFVAIIGWRDEENEVPEILLGERADGKGSDLPGGGAREGESDRDAAIRRARDETGLEVVPLWQIGGDHILPAKEGREEDVARVYFASVVGGELLPSTADVKQNRFFTLAELTAPDAPQIVSRPTPDHPGGRMMAMIRQALQTAIVTSFVNDDEETEAEETAGQIAAPPN